MNQANPQLSILTDHNSQSQPGKKVFSSRSAGWESLLVEVFEAPNEVEAFEPVATPDQVIVLMLQGEYEIESFSERSWKRALYREGTGGLTAPMHTSRLRWYGAGEGVCRTLHLWIPHQTLLEACEEFNRVGRPRTPEALDTLSFSDPMLFQIGKELLKEASQGALSLYADAAACFMAKHLLQKQDQLLGSRAARQPGELTDARLARVLQYLEHHVADQISLLDLAQEAGISRFHFVRVFRDKLGITPHRYLTRLRMQRAARLLADTDSSIAQTAASCGYRHVGHFAAAFKQQFARSPMAYRQERRI